MSYLPQPYGSDWKIWAQRLIGQLSQSLSSLQQQTGNESAAQDGVFMWSRLGYPVVSASNVFREVIIKRAVPASSVGAAGDKAGMVAIDTNYIYVCVAAHDGSTHIWKRATLAGGSW